MDDLADPAAPGTDALTRAERLVLWAFRHWAAGPASWRDGCREIVWRELVRRCGGAGAESAMRSLAQLVRALAGHARRPLRHCPLGSRLLGADERALLALIAAAQAGQHTRVDALALWLVRRAGQGELARGAAALGAALADNDLILPDRCGAQARARHDAGERLRRAH